jgi:hypothetical protein
MINRATRRERKLMSLLDSALKAIRCKRIHCRRLAAREDLTATDARGAVVETQKKKKNKEKKRQYGISKRGVKSKSKN